MRLFNLQSKTSLAGWSVVLGWVIYIIDKIVYGAVSINNCTSTLNDTACSRALAPHYLLFFQNEYYNIIFWILVSLIVLSLIKYIKKSSIVLIIILVIVLAGVVYLKQLQNISNKNLTIRRQNPIPRLPHSNTSVPRGIYTPPANKIDQSKQYVKGEVIIILKDNTANPDQRIKEIADTTNAVIVGSDVDLKMYELMYGDQNRDELLSIISAIESLPDVESAIISVLGGLNFNNY